MRQAPHYLIIGDGCLASHLLIYFKQLGISHTQWSRSSQPFDLNQHLSNFTHCLLAISDQAIEPFAKSLGWHNHPIQMLHCSASAKVDGIDFAHPLMAFARNTKYPLATYKAMPFVIDADGPDLSSVLPGLPNPSIRIGSDQRHLYHALCVLGGNYTTMLWQKFFMSMQSEFGIEKKHLLPYFNQIHYNAWHADQPLTGPLVRNDQDTLQSHLASLANDPYGRVYESFCRAYEENQHA